MTDPIEKIIANALESAGLKYETDFGGKSPLDFYIPSCNVYIEVKQFYSPRIVEQMARADNVIAIQGRTAAEWFAKMLAGDGC